MGSFVYFGVADLLEEIVSGQGIHVGFLTHGLYHALPELARVYFLVFVYTLYAFLNCSFHGLQGKQKLFPLRR